MINTLYTYLLDLTDEKSVYNYINIVYERLYIMILIYSILFSLVLLGLIMNNSNNYIFSYMVLLLSISTIWIIFYILYYINKVDKPHKTINLLLFLNIYYLFTQLFGIFVMYYTINKSTAFQLQNYIVFNVIMTYVYMSNYTKILVISLLFLLLIYVTIYLENLFNIIDMIWLNMIVFIFLAINLIQQGVIIYNYKERYERYELSTTTMHDLRNYVYCLKIDSISNHGILNEKVESIKIDYETDNEFENLVKMITTKICYLYHTELAFEHNYNIDAKKYDCLKIINDVKDTFQVIFKDKNIKIVLLLQSNTKNIKIDYKMFEYLMIYLTKSFLEFNYDDLLIQIKIIENDFYIKLDLNFKLNSIHYKSINILWKKLLYGKLIESLNKKVSYTTTNDNDSINYSINLYDDDYDYGKELYMNIDNYFNQNRVNVHFEIPYIYNSEIIVKNNSKKIFVDIDNKNKKELNKSSTLNKCSLKELNTVKYTIENKTIYINIDDESCILKMNSRILKKYGVTLNCCIDRRSFLLLLTKINMDMNNDLISDDTKLICFMDHILDNDFGYMIIQEVRNRNVDWNLDMRFILLSSTEDSDTKNIYLDLNIREFVTKPLTISKLKEKLSNNPPENIIQVQEESLDQKLDINE